MEANFRSKISKLVNKLEEKGNERGQVEMTPRSEIYKQVELKEMDEKYREREQAGATVRRQLQEIRRRMEAKGSHCQEVETLKSQIELQRKLQEHTHLLCTKA
jgi:hypothetical protein